MIDVLNEIVYYKKKEIEVKKSKFPTSSLLSSPNYHRSCNSLVERLLQKTESGIIAEFKRKSPSRQNINLAADIEKVIKGYAQAGASGISILTDHHYFGGSDQFMVEARQWLAEMPLLRKEFIVDEYQVHESKALGADVVLLIAEILDREEVVKLGQLAIDLGMEVLLELHGEDQLPKTEGPLSMIGINNRDLRTFEVDYERSISLLGKLRNDVPRIAESGLSEPSTVAMLKRSGFQGFLIGEQFMKHTEPSLACASFIREVYTLENDFLNIEKS